MIVFAVINTRTGEIVKTYKSRQRARNSRDRYNALVGAEWYIVQVIEGV